MAGRSLAVTLVAVVGIVYGGLVMLVGVLFWLALPGVMAWIGHDVVHDPATDAETAQALSGMLKAASLLSGLFGAAITMLGMPMLLAGLGVWKRRPWGRNLTLGLAGVMALMAIGFLKEGDTLGLALTAGYAAVAFGVLLAPRYAAEFVRE